MPKRRTPKSVRTGGKRPEDSLAFVVLQSIGDQLGNILRLGLVVGFVAILDPLLAKIEHYVDGDIEPTLTAIEPGTELASDPDQIDRPPSDAALRAIRESDERLQFVSNCTRVEFQKSHYDDCFPDGSDVYPRPTADENDGSMLLMLEKQTLYAGR